MELFTILEDCEDNDVKSKEASEALVGDDSSRIEFKANDELFKLVEKKESLPSSCGMIRLR